MENKICCFFNMAPHYRSAIYHKMDAELKCDFYLGDHVSNIKRMDYSSLQGFKKELIRIDLFGNFYWLKGMISTALKGGYDTFIISGEIYCLSNWVLLILSKLTDKRVIGWSHGWFHDGSFIQQILYKRFFSMMYKILLYGNYAKKYMSEHGIAESKMLPIYNSLDYELQLKVRKGLQRTKIYQSHFNNVYPVLLYIGRIQKRKKIDQIVDAMNLLQNRGVLVNFVCIGGYIEDKELIEKIRNYNLGGRIWEYGPLYEEDKKGMMIYNADICVSPGNVGLTAIDCLMYGLPIITNNDFKTQMPEFEAIQEGVSGLFFRKDDVSDLAHQIELLLDKENQQSKEEIAAKCYSIIDQKYNPSYQIEVLKSVVK